MEISCTLGLEIRKEAKCMGTDNRGSHLTKEERKIIARGLKVVRQRRQSEEQSGRITQQLGKRSSST